MDLSTCLVIYLIIVILITVWMYKTKHTIWASLLYGLIFGVIVLIIIQPPSEIDPYSTSVESTSALYLLILILTPVYVIIYSLRCGYFDYRKVCYRPYSTHPQPKCTGQCRHIAITPT